MTRETDTRLKSLMKSVLGSGVLLAELHLLQWNYICAGFGYKPIVTVDI